MKHWTVLLAAMLAYTISVSPSRAAEVVTLDGVTLESSALDNGCSSDTLSSTETTDCRYRVCYSLLKSLWLLDEANRQSLEPDKGAMERQQREYEKSNVGENLTFTVMPRLKFQRDVIELYRKNHAEDPKYTIDELWNDVSTSATELEIPERALRALVQTYGSDEQRFVEFQKMFPDDHESAMARSKNNWEREARRVALEKKISSDDSLTSAELTKARVEWKQQLETAPDATDIMLRQRKHQYQVNVYFRNKIRDDGQFADGNFRMGLLDWINTKILGPDDNVFGEN